MLIPRSKQTGRARRVAALSRPALTLPMLAIALAMALLAAGCNDQVERFLSVAIPITYQDGLLYAYGEALPTMDERCNVDPGEARPERPGSMRVLVDAATPLSVMSDAAGRSPQPFRHGQVQINATQPDGQMGAARFVLCDMPLVRGNQALSEFRLDRKEFGAAAVTTGPLGAVLGGDLFGRYAMSLDVGAASAQLTLQRSDITPGCLIDRAAIPFQPVGGDLLVQVGDSILSYSPTRITVGACVEPVADPLVQRPAPMTGIPQVQSCIDRDRLNQAKLDIDRRLSEESAKEQPDAEMLSRLNISKQVVDGLTGPKCELITDLTQLGDVVEAQSLRRLPYQSTGVNMRFLLSTAVPDLIMSETACGWLGAAAGTDRCHCADADSVELRLPGLDGPQPDNTSYVERGCRLKLGGAGRAALALVARQLHLSPCAELARSRRQRFASPQLPDADRGSSDCLREACLENLTRQSNLTADRCGYSGMQVQEACDDHRAPVTSLVELGGPPDDPTVADDLIDVLVVPDTARILQSANIDLRNATAQVDGVIGVSLLRRLHTVIDYPQNRLVLSCPCSATAPGSKEVCRGYHGLSYYDYDHCVPNNPLVIPADYGRAACNQ